MMVLMVVVLHKIRGFGSGVVQGDKKTTTSLFAIEQDPDLPTQLQSLCRIFRIYMKHVYLSK